MNIDLRPAAEQDRVFVEQVYFQTQRWIIETLFGWRGERAEHERFEGFYREARTEIIVIDGKDSGWLSVRRESRKIRLESIFLVPEMQRRGVGSILLRGLIDEAHASQIPLFVSTAKINPARELYERLGFVVVRVDRHKVHFRFRTSPSVVRNNATVYSCGLQADIAEELSAG